MTDLILLYFVRHGETKLNQENRFRGPLNIPLSDKGKLQAKALAHYFRNVVFTCAYSSDRDRAIDTAEAILKAQKDPPELEKLKELRAWDLGDFAGKPKDRANLAALKKYVNNPEEVVPGGESLNAFRGRIRPVIEEVLHELPKIGGPGLFVVHSSVIHELGEMFEEDHEVALVEPGGVATVYLEDGHLCAEAVYRAEPANQKGGYAS